MKLKCSAPATLGKCDEGQFHRTEDAMDQRRDVERVAGHSLWFSLGILAKQMVISNSKTGVDLKRLLKLPQGQLESL